MMNGILRLWVPFFDTMRAGGYIMWPICVASIMVWTLGIEKYFQIRTIRKKIVRTGLSSFITTDGSGTAGTSLLQTGAVHRFSPENYARLFEEIMIDAVPPLEKGFSTMSALIKAAPLLGLTGTVIGMVQTFAVIMEFGIGNPQMMAEGIHIALLTTQAGLLAAFPGMLLHNMLVNEKERCVTLLEKEGEKFYLRSVLHGGTCA